MYINKSNVPFSSIVEIGQKIKKASLESGEKYLELNRGVNSVVGIDLSEVLKNINPNTTEFQVYAPNLGLEKIRKSIANVYFNSKKESSFNKISITPGGVSALDLVIQTLDVDTIYLPKFYWGPYSNIAKIRKTNFKFYENLEELSFLNLNNRDCVFISDPNNPTGLKMDDDFLYENIKRLDSIGVVIVFDCPYRRLFFNDNFFDLVSDFENVIITESFSKWVGLSGLRIGFIYSNNEEFNKELNIRLLYEFNAVSTVSQLIINEVLESNVGKIAVDNFKNKTTHNIRKNIDYLSDNNLLVEDIYKGRKPVGIFAVVNKSESFLFENKIGAVSLSKFVFEDKQKWENYSRICVSVSHREFVDFFNKII